MSYFYGNITNPAYRQFQFDKIYANKQEMDSDAGNDNVYQNRFVLINYSKEINLNSIQTIYDLQLQNIPGEDSTEFYTAYLEPSNPETVKEDSRKFCLASEGVNLRGTIFKDIKGRLYYVSNKTTKNNISGIATTSYALFSPVISLNETLTVEEQNHRIDQIYTHTAEKYNSTVWMKIFRDNTASYEFIADISKSNETFDLVEIRNQPGGGTVKVQAITGLSYDKDTNKLKYSKAAVDFASEQDIKDFIEQNLSDIKNQMAFDYTGDESSFIRTRVKNLENMAPTFATKYELAEVENQIPVWRDF